MFQMILRHEFYRMSNPLKTSLFLRQLDMLLQTRLLPRQPMALIILQNGQ